MNLVELTVPMPGAAASDRAREALATAEYRQISTDADYQTAGAELLAIKAKIREIDDSRKALKRPIDDAAKRIQDFFRGPLDFLTRAETILKTKMSAYARAVEQKRLEAQRRADEAARKEQEKLAAKAAAAAAAGKPERAAQLEQRAASVVPTAVTTQAPAVAGVQTRTAWKFQITDAALVPREYLVVDESAIRRVVGALKDRTNIPGVRVWAEDSIAASAV